MPLRSLLGIFAQRAMGVPRCCADAQWIWRAAHGSAAGPEGKLLSRCRFQVGKCPFLTSPATAALSIFDKAYTPLVLKSAVSLSIEVPAEAKSGRGHEERMAHDALLRALITICTQQNIVLCPATLY